MYKVLVDFVDLQDNNRKYSAGDKFPRAGYEPSKDRIAALLSNKNKRGTAIIIEVKPETKPVEKETLADKPKKGRKKNDAK